MRKRILFTGGSGKAGKHTVEYLIAQGHRVLNVDLVPLECLTSAPMEQICGIE